MLEMLCLVTRCRHACRASSTECWCETWCSVRRPLSCCSIHFCARPALMTVSYPSWELMPTSLSDRLHSLHSILSTNLHSIHTSGDSVYWKYWYIVFDIDISYRIISLKQYRIFRHITIFFLYITIFSMYHDILCETFVFLLLHYQNNESKWRKLQTNQSKLTLVS